MLSHLKTPVIRKVMKKAVFNDTGGLRLGVGSGNLRRNYGVNWGDYTGFDGGLRSYLGKFSSPCKRHHRDNHKSRAASIPCPGSLNALCLQSSTCPAYSPCSKILPYSCEGAYY